MASYQHETFARRNGEQRLRIGTLLADLQRSLQLIKAEIEIEEERTHWPIEDPRYPAMCHALRARQDNLEKTIGMIKELI